MEFEAKLENLPIILGWVLEQIENVGFDKSSLNKIELALEEVVVNIIHHGYKGASGKIVLKVATKPKKFAKVTITDFCPAFNLLEYDKQHVKSDLEDMDVGGLGIHFIRNSMDEVRYLRRGKTNVLTLTKKC